MYSNSILLERVQLGFLRAVATILSSFGSVWAWHALTDQRYEWSAYIGPSILAATVVVALLWSTPSRFASAADELRPIAKGVLFTTFILMAFSFFLQSDAYSRGTLIVFLPMLVAVLFAANKVDRYLTSRLERSTSATSRVLLVGYGEHGKRVASALALRPGYYSLLGYLDRPSVALADNSPIAYLGTTDDLATALSDNDVDEAIIALGDASEEELQELIGVCMAARVRWKVMPPMLDLRLDQIRFDTVGGLPVVEARGPKLVGYNWHLKRVVDFAGSVLLLVLLSPILVVAYLLVKLTSRGPGIYRQSRVGLHGEAFTMYKFRTMTVSNDPAIHEDAAVAWVYGDGYDGDSSTTTYKKSDSRVTAVGKVLRATSIDELPQLWNVASGDMSLVGPRPPMAYEVDQYTERDRRRLDVPPGVTGLWQVSGRNSLSFDEMVDLDLDYIDSWSVALDVSILLRTIPAVVIDRGK